MSSMAVAVSRIGRTVRRTIQAAPAPTSTISPRPVSTVVIMDRFSDAIASASASAMLLSTSVAYTPAPIIQSHCGMAVA